MTELKSKRRKRLWLGCLLALFLAGVVAGWIVVKRQVHATIKRELTQLADGGTVHIASVGVGINGVSANQIKFVEKDEDDAWLTVDRLSIREPIWNLIFGTSEYDRVTVTAPQAVVGWDQSNQSMLDVDNVMSLEIPSAEVAIKQAGLIVRQTGRRDLTVNDLNARLVKTAQGLSVSGQSSSVAGNPVEFHGAIRRDQRAFRLTVRSESFEIRSDEWTQWPGIPEDLDRHLSADGSANIEFQLHSTRSGQLAFDSTIQPKSVRLWLSAFDMSLEVSDGQINLSPNDLTFANLKISTDANSSISATGQSEISSFPLTTTFKANLSRVADNTLRKLVPQIPEVVKGRVDGTASGRVEVTENLETFVAVRADVVCKDLRYGDMTYDDSTVVVDLERLHLDGQGQPTQLAGDVSVTAETTKQPVSNLFSTFDLQTLQGQLGLIAEMDANVSVQLPLATIEDLNTWIISVTGNAHRAVFSGQPLGTCDATAQLKDGRLVLDPISARLPATGNSLAESEIEVAIDWPLTVDTTEPHTGKVQITGRRVPPQWLVDVSRFHDRPVVNPDVQAQLQRALQQEPAELGGHVNFGTNLTLNVLELDDLNSWQLEGKISDATVRVANESLQEFSTRFRAENGNIKIDDAAGTFSSGGFLKGEAIVQLANFQLNSARVSVNEIPLSWSTQLASRLNDEFAETLKKAEIESADGNHDLSGYYSATLTVQPTHRQPNQPDAWQLHATVQSDHLRFKRQAFSDIRCEARVNASEINIDRLRATLVEGGNVSAKGRWNTHEHNGFADCEWSAVAIKKVFSELGLDLEKPIEGTTNGRVTVRSLDREAVEAEIPWQVAGRVEAVGLSLDPFTAPRQSFSFAVESRGSLLHFDQFKVPDHDEPLGISAELQWQAPHAFQVESDIESMPVDRVTSLEIANRNSLTQWMAELSGELATRFTVVGTLKPFDWSSSGSAELRNARFQNRSLGPVQARWTDMGASRPAAAAMINLLGGRIEATNLDFENQGATIIVNDLDAQQASTILDLPLLFSGQLSGNATFTQWSDVDKREIEAQIRGGSTSIRDAELSELDGFLRLKGSRLSYGLTGRVLSGRITGNGETILDPLAAPEYPVELRMDDVSLKRLYAALRPDDSRLELDGRVSVSAAVKLSEEQPAEARGRLNLSNVRFKQELVSRAATSQFVWREGVLELLDWRSEVLQGEVSGNVSLPINQASPGNYNILLRRVDLRQLSRIFNRRPIDIDGSVDARLAGQVGRTITGRGQIGLVRAELGGRTRHSFKLPIQFRLNSTATSGRVEFRRSQFRLFGGRVSGQIRLDFDDALDVDVDLAVSDLDTAELFQAAGIQQSQHGSLSGRLRIRGTSVREARHLSGSFKGNLTRVQSFKLPVFEGLAIFLNNRALINRTFDSNEIDLQLSNGAISIRRLNFTSPSAKIAVFGTAYLDKRLNLQVAARIERFDQPTLIDEFLDSPLVLLGGSTAVFYSQVAKFLSDRIVRVRVGGNISRPIFRLDTSAQIQEELIRYFLREAPIPTIRQNRQN